VNQAANLAKGSSESKVIPEQASRVTARKREQSPGLKCVLAMKSFFAGLNFGVVAGLLLVPKRGELIRDLRGPRQPRGRNQFRHNRDANGSEDSQEDPGFGIERNNPREQVLVSGCF
jgi:hypothetical protein